MKSILRVRSRARANDRRNYTNLLYAGSSSRILFKRTNQPISRADTQTTKTTSLDPCAKKFREIAREISRPAGRLDPSDELGPGDRSRAISRDLARRVDWIAPGSCGNLGHLGHQKIRPRRLQDAALKRKQRAILGIARCSEHGGVEDYSAALTDAVADADAESLTEALFERGHSMRCLMMRRLSA